MAAMKPARYSFCSRVNSPAHGGASASFETKRLISGILLQAHCAEFQFGLARDGIRFAGGGRVHAAVLAKRLSPVESHEERARRERLIYFQGGARATAARHQPDGIVVHQPERSRILGMSCHEGR